MTLTPAQKQHEYRQRKLKAFRLIKQVALEAGIMQFDTDADGYDEFIGLLDSGEFELRFEVRQEK